MADSRRFFMSARYRLCERSFPQRRSAVASKRAVPRSRSAEETRQVFAERVWEKNQGGAFGGGAGTADTPLIN